MARPLSQFGRLRRGGARIWQERSAFAFKVGPPVDPSGQLDTGEAFGDILQLKQLLLQQERAIARNLTKQFLVYATGAPPRISDRVEIESILDQLAGDHFPVRSLIEQVVCSTLFLIK